MSVIATVYIFTGMLLGMAATIRAQGAFSFIGAPYLARIYSNAPAGTHVLTVSAVPSSGITTGQAISYFTSNNAKAFFSMNQSSGEITINRPFSNRIGQRFVFDVIAKQGVRIGQSRVTVLVSEENRYPPVFSRPYYDTVVWRGSVVGTAVMTVNTTDNDKAPYNRDVSYSIKENSGGDAYFFMDDDEVRLKRQLPQDQGITQIDVTVVAKDHGVPQKTASVTLSVNISLISGPTQLQVKFSNETAITLCWREPARGVRIQGYRVEYWPIDDYDVKDSVTVAALTSSSLYCTTVVNLTSWEVYHFQVSAYDNNGAGVPSVIPNVLTVPQGVCGLRPCRNDGSCVATSRRPGFKCECKEGYYNDTCELINACDLHSPCKNNATCVHTDTEGDYTCTCAPGWTGTNCTDYNPCLLSPCANNATCSQIEGGASSTFQCDCDVGYYGDTCQSFNPCVSSPCFGNATCENVTSDTFQCDCPDGFYGKVCDQAYNKCVGDVCENMRCTGGGAGGTQVCSCNDGYYGDDCQYFDYCSRMPCENNGTCQNQNETYKCTCANGYYGNHCQFRNPCEIVGCLNGGRCENVSLTDFICHCREGYSGENCESYDPCVSSPCYNSAVCNRTGNANYSCVCAPGYHGDLCEQHDPCFSSPCSAMSTCNATSNETFICACAHGYYGERCDFFDICSIDGLCENGGTCSNGTLNNTYTCDCPGGYRGEICELRDPCFTADCRNNATCRPINETSYECACATGYQGEHCEDVDPCAQPFVCFNGGVCAAKANGTYECKCGAGLFGNRCQNYNFCSSSVCQNGGSCVLSNVTATLPYSAIITEQSVIRGSNSDQSYIVNSYQCACADPYTGENCETSLGECFFRPCKNNATCVDLPGGYRCDCKPGFHGFNCGTDSDECLSSPCKDGATCVDHVNAYSCVCPSSLTGTHCEDVITSANMTEIPPVINSTADNPCDSNPCHGNATCIIKNTNENENPAHACVCPPNTTGTACDEMTSQSPSNTSTNVSLKCESCKNNASCDTSPDGSIICVCSANFTGVNCETEMSAPEVDDPCLEQPCLNNGTCISNNDDGTFSCACVEMYTGVTCEREIVQGDSSNQTQNFSSTPCSSNPCMNSGSCLESEGTYTCVCQPPFTGEDCGHHIEGNNGTSAKANSTNICASISCKNNATCIEENGDYRCICSANFVGRLCETFELSNDNETDFNSSNICDPNPCLNNGSCLVRNGNVTCVCSSGFTGKTCDMSLANNDSYSGGSSSLCDENPCWNGATCVIINQNFRCECPSGYMGRFCDQSTEPDDESDPICGMNPCENNGTCIKVGATYRCECRAGFHGRDCDIQTSNSSTGCDSRPCANNGTCLPTGEGFHCQCLEGFIGRLCEETSTANLCTPGYCLNGGICISNGSRIECACYSNFTGSRCELSKSPISACASSPCHRWATCLEDSFGGYTCICAPGKTGPRCHRNIDACSSRPCQHRGNCTVDTLNNTLFSCTCKQGYSGALCEFKLNDTQDACAGHVCYNNGTCTSSPQGPVCLCQEQFTGDDCRNSLNPCASDPCFGNSRCEVLGDSYRCICSDGSTDPLCRLDENPCSSNPCLNSGTCNDRGNGTFQCACAEGFQGPICDVAKDPCLLSPCVNNASCIRLENATNAYRCHCQSGYGGANCQDELDECRSNPCANNATCVDLIGGYRCQCHVGYTGDKCESIIDLCASNPCSETSRQCVPLLNDYKCVCMAGFDGPDCAVNIDECASSPCHLEHSTYCKDGVNTYVCECKTGFTGKNCEINLDECRSDPCLNGGTCVDGTSGYTCTCAKGYSGVHCQVAETCESKTLINSKGKFLWPASQHSLNLVSLKCPYGSLDGKGMATRRCTLDSNGVARWEPPQLDQCKELGTEAAKEVATQSANVTSVPEKLVPDEVSSVADEMQIVLDYAMVDMEIAQNMLSTISNVMDAGEEVLHESNAESHAAERLVQVLEDFTGGVNLTAVSKIQLSSDNIAIESMEVPLPKKKGSAPSKDDNSTEGGVKTEWKNTKMFLPFEVFEMSAADDSHTNATYARVSFVYYANSKFFMEENHTENKYGPLENRRVVAATVKKTHVLNLSEPVVFTLPNVEIGVPHICAFWNTTARMWSTEGLEVNSTNENATTCFSRHLTNFAILLDPTPSEAIPIEHQISLAVISYIGCGLSLCGLVLTILTYGLFRCLHGDNSGKILISLCTSMLLMNIAFVAGTARAVSDAQIVCTIVAVLLHYLTLTTLMWMLIEAVHMYRLLVKIFRTYEPRFMLKRLLIAWGIPLVIVGITVGISVDNYGGRDDLCRLTSANPYVYYISFLGPSCLILIFNSVVFVLVSRVILRPRVKGLKGKRSQEQPKVSAAQVRGAISVMVLLGITWVFGAFAAGDAKVVFAYIFCVANSLQGFLIFLFRCLLHPEARSAWVQLVTTGTLKKTRSRASSRASSGEHTNSHNSHHHDNRRTFKDTFTTNKIVKNTNVWHKARRFSSDSQEKNLKPLKYHDINLSYSIDDKFDNPLFKALNNSSSMAGPDDTKL